MKTQTFVYVSYIKSDADAIWSALTSSEFSKQYWFGSTIRTDWKVGSEIQLINEDNVTVVVGKVLAFNKPKMLAYSWTDQKSEKGKSEAPSKVTFQIDHYEPNAEVMKLTVTHEGFAENSDVFPRISNGWPMVLSNLKTMLETAKAMRMHGTCKKD